ncbi:TonB-dependent receptor family protein [Allomuricauda sp. SCSIO 65647]|uniref:TonB-dependent receptor family protein n=1 Tax=Allomuricauda sp. SCSIO 65647 TaxID=2908843 RepID=UPI001F1B2AFD|nr:TonB-dependent receptor [Muricauda sp. SCSIO 65647]UJH66811.1 TonB-dependent receptor [Muricauda sp. SCSIO 65647]
MNGRFILFFSLLSISVLSQQTPQQLDSIRLNEVVISAKKIFGSKFEARNRTGSSYYISPQEIKKFNYTDVNRTLRSVPGVNVYEEDGFGLRPNISLRGTSPERSAKITLMEDGVLIAPAPYSAPSAYYFPTIARMQAVEILKGSSQIQYGPYTTGGAINMLSTEVPDTFSAVLNSSYGSFQSGRVHALLGDSKKNFGYAIEYLNYNSNGFKELEGFDNTGFDKNDLMAKFRVNTNPEAEIGQAFEVKFQYSDETSNETYLGLTQEDFDIDPFARYAGSQRDQMNNEHLQFMGTHTLKFSDYFRITTTGYYNKFERNWYKVDFITVNGQREGISNVLGDPVAFDGYYDLVRGAVNSDGDDFLNARANNREYYAAGVQTKLDYHWTGEKTFHDIEIGFRYHYDEEDRFQWIDDYSMNNGTMVLVNAGIPGTNANRISNARAFAAYAQYKIKYNDLTLTPGLRYENMTLMRKNYGTNDVDRTGIDLSERENKVDVFIPGMGFNYNFDNISVFGGVHKGFSPPSNQPDEDPEQSVNYELGSRFSYAGFTGEVVGFYNDYSNLLGSDLAATGGTGSLDQFNAGEVKVQGIEVLLNYNLLPNAENFILPVTFGYTFTDTEFLNSFGSENDIWGEVNAGDELPYIAKHQFNTTISLEHSKYEINLSARYNGEFRTQAGSGNIPADERVDSNFIFDLAGKYRLGKNIAITANVINLFDETYAVARVPAGLRPGHPFGIYAGLELRY